MPSGDPSAKELAWKVASELLEANRFVTIEDQRSREIFRYGDGVYVPDGEAYIKQKIQENFEVKEEVSTHLVNEVTAHVERSTIKPRSIFEESNPHLVLQNGLLNLLTLELEPFSPDHYALNKLPVKFDSSKGCPGPAFERFINDILPPEDVQGVQEELGAILRKKYLTKKFSIYLGDTDTGKTTLINVLTKLIGPENVSSVSIQDLASKNPFFLAQLFAKMANIRDDVSRDIVYSVGKLKELTGGYKVNAQKKHKDPFDFENSAYLIFTCNNLPPIDEDDAAFFNRVMIRYFTRKFGGREQPDRDLVSKLTTPDELSGILNWGIEGLKRLQANGWNFSNTSTVDSTRENYKRQSDPVWAFVEDCLEEETESALTKERLYNSFKIYCRDKSIPLLSKDGFYKTLPEKIKVTSGYRQVEGEEGRKHCFIGLKFIDALHDFGVDSRKNAGSALQGRLEQVEQPDAPVYPRDTKSEQMFCSVEGCGIRLGASPTEDSPRSELTPYKIGKARFCKTHYLERKPNQEGNRE